MQTFDTHDTGNSKTGLNIFKETIKINLDNFKHNVIPIDTKQVPNGILKYLN